MTINGYNIYIYIYIYTLIIIILFLVISLIKKKSLKKQTEEKEYIRDCLEINKDITILQDFSSGSNAITILCTNNKYNFFRKYSIGEDSKKLYEQILWINKYKNKLKLTDIIKYYNENKCCYYDMPYIPEAISFFNYIHSKPIMDSWNILKDLLENLNKNLYQNQKEKAQLSKIDSYINEKVINNLQKIEKSKYIKELLKYDELIINGKKYKNLQMFKKYLTYDYLYEIFKNDEYTDIHGDLTVENIICLPNNKYYLIDPNTGNIHSSPNLDYAKLLQSLHGSYELLMNIKNIDINNNSISYLNIESLSYKNMYLKYNEYLKDNFSEEKVKSVYFHEIVHWIRLLPYKIKKDERLSVVFYCGFIITINDIIERFGGDKSETKIGNF